MAIAGLVALALAAITGAVALRPDLVLVEHVVFEGAHRASERSLRHLVDIRNGDTLWGVDLAAVGRGAARHPWVRHAEARREWPSRVVVRVDEHVPVALVQIGGLYYVDRDGEPFLRATGELLDLPVVSGLGSSHEEAHPALPRSIVRDALALVDALEEQGLVARDRVSEVAFSDTRGFTVHLARGARLVFGVDGHARQVARLERLVADSGLDLALPVQVDLAPASVAIVRPLPPRGSGG